MTFTRHVLIAIGLFLPLPGAGACDCESTQGRTGRVAGVTPGQDTGAEDAPTGDLVVGHTDAATTDTAAGDVAGPIDTVRGDDTAANDVDAVAADTVAPVSDAADTSLADLSGGDTGVTGGIPVITMDQLRAADDLTALAGRPLLDHVTVTYVRPPSDNGNGFYVQDDPVGPGIFFYSAAAPGGVLVSVGDLIRVRVALVDTWFGLKEVTFFDAPEILSSGNDVEEFVQDLSDGTHVTEALESELVRITDATLLWRSGNVAEIGYGPTGTTAQLYAPVMGALGLSAGARFDLDAVGGDYLGDHQVTAYRVEDFSNIR